MTRQKNDKIFIGPGVTINNAPLKYYLPRNNESGSSGGSAPGGVNIYR